MQEKQNENTGSAVGGFGQPAQNVDATGRMIRDDTPPVPKKKPLDSPFRPTILKGIDNKTVITDIQNEEGKPDKNNFMFKDTAKDGGKVTVAGGILLNTVEDAKKLPFTVPDAQGGRRPATSEEIEQAFREVDAFQQPEDEDNKRTASGFDPKENNKFHDLRLPTDIAKRLFNESIRSSANELRRKFNNFDDLPSGAKRGLLDLEFNLGRKFNKNNWPSLFESVQDKDWKQAADESSRKTKGSKGMKERNANTKRKFLDALGGR